MTLLRTPTDVGAAIRQRRKQLGLGQAELASLIGTSRQWVIGAERGRARTELGLALRALDALGIRLTAQEGTAARKSASGVDLDSIVAAARKKKT